MPVPSFQAFIEPVLRHLADHPEGLPAAQVHDAVAGVLGLSDQDKALLLPSGLQPVYKNRAGWAHDRLKRAGLSSSPRRGFWKITEAGMQHVAVHPEPFDPHEVDRLAYDYLQVRLGPDEPPEDDQPPPGTTPLANVEGLSPEELVERAVAQLNSAVAAELRELFNRCSPGFFETLVLDLLHAMGYGTSRSDLQRLGGAADGGVDGVISLDRLGLEKVYVQAKRWLGTPVGRPEVQAFYGALAGQRAKKGVFITASSFSQPALEFARSVEGVVLVDGTRLAQLMIQHGIAVTQRAISLPRVDHDYFEEQ